ncbi:MAG: L-2-hydroxyglutarate oxidase [Nitrospinota bacterium]
METADILIVGAGIIGMATALELQTRYPSSRITVLEKEAAPALHQSRYNSGVIHAGVYYRPGSLKARFCREGVQTSEAFCSEHSIPFKRLGKLIVATSEAEVTPMANLAKRARQNGIVIEDIDQVGLRQMEPYINGVAAIYSPSTGITDYKYMTEVMAKLFRSRNGKICYGERVITGRETEASMSIITSKGRIESDRVITCAGLHSDRLILAFGQNPGYRVIPFRGEFFRLMNQPDNLVSHLIYPVPDLKRPFLGVHLTRKIAGDFTVGPNAVLAFKREGYRLMDISLKDMIDTFSYPGFWRMLAQNVGPTMSELLISASKLAYLKRIHKYCSKIQYSDLKPYPAGVRAQAVAPDGKIIDDFLFVQTKRCLHVGNAPSPAATSAMPIARHIANQLYIDSDA